MHSFTCNICGAANTLEDVPWEPSTCADCGSNVRMRALIHLLSIELYGQARPLTKFEKNKGIRGFGLSDALLYAVPLAKLFDYTNTFYDRQPYLDMTAPHPEQYGTYDFILSSDVFEHVAPPVERAFQEAAKLLKPNGFMCITVPSSGADEATIEFYPDLHDYSIVQLGGEYVLINRKQDKTLEIHQNLEFHGGIGATLVMRQFSQRDLSCQLRGSGFSEVIYQTASVEPSGIILPGNWSLPLVARKDRYTLAPAQDAQQLDPEPEPETALAAQEHAPPPAEDEKTVELQRRVVALESQLRIAANSRWLKLGQRLGFGPRLQ